VEVVPVPKAIGLADWKQSGYKRDVTVQAWLVEKMTEA